MESLVFDINQKIGLLFKKYDFLESQVKKPTKKQTNKKQNWSYDGTRGIILYPGERVGME